MKYVYVRRHAGVLASGRPVSPGETVELTKDEQAANQRLIDNGILQLIPEKTKPKTRKAEKPVEENLDE